ncbi:MAG: addiction module toxin, HicA family [Alphaproteobacteria bacterium]|jgi:predicted RNA binding protein YcfA (HicA-like mRNA interferase family)|nr:MAG: addiction module toxin, HicA family [Alphaproteobacteria bacterium]
MSERLPTLKALAVIRALERAGFVVVRSAGSHHRLVHSADARRATTVPVHKGRDLPRPMLRAIIKQAGLTAEEFVDLL